MFEIKKCKTKAAYKAQPLKNVNLDLNKLKEKYETSFDSKIVIIIKLKGYEITIHKFGEIIFKNCIDKKFMEKTAQEIYDESLLR
ncbi:MAG: hypothetical protein Q8Q35_02695 [Nanoarchaeota archaeon]|nr:hypothetical protein [Nanoarchaeota archaeon]